MDIRLKNRKDKTVAKVVNIEKQTEEEEAAKAYQAGYEFCANSGLLEQIKGLWAEFEKQFTDQAKLAGVDEDTFIDGAACALADMVDDEIVMLDEEEGEGD